MNGIKSFFQNTIVRIVSIVLWVLSTASLLIGGITQETLNGVMVAIIAVISAISALAAIIGAIIKKQSTTGN